MILDEIIANKAEEIHMLRHRFKGISKEMLNEFPPSRDFRKAFSKEKFAIIAEAKKASPSAGEIVKDYNPTVIARNYEIAGASAVSILTDYKYFKGSLDHIKAAKDSTTIPILRKEFIIDAAQIYESRIAGADALLLIVRILSDEQLTAFLKLCRELDMEALVEVHDVAEAKRALNTDARIIGINNRDLDTLKIDIQNTIDILNKLPRLKERIVITESGIKSAEDIKKLRAAGCNGALIGETLLKSKNISKTMADLLKA